MDPGGVYVETIVLPGPFLVVRVEVEVATASVEDVVMATIVAGEVKAASAEIRGRKVSTGCFRVADISDDSQVEAVRACCCC